METVKTVLWGMIGIRRRVDHERAGLKPVHLIATALVLLIAFILTLRFVVGVIVS